VTQTQRGWKSVGLKTVGDDPGLWSAQQAASLLGPPELSVTQVRALIRCAGLEPVAKRRTTLASGRHSRVYAAEDLIYDAIYRVTGPVEQAG
jgi:hypothetical protein